MFKRFFTAIWEGFRSVMKFLLRKPVTALANKISSAPKRTHVFDALTKLYNETIDKPGEKKGTMFEFDHASQSVIIFSDHHKGCRDGSDDFTMAEKSYLAALDHYNDKKFYYINLGDSEELWENKIFSVLKNNKATFEKEKLFVDRTAYCKIYGNHDNLWRFDPLAPQYLKEMYGTAPKIFGGIVMRAKFANDRTMDIFCTHGHQGDLQSDGNWFSAWFVSYIWAPFQSFLQLNTNTPAFSDSRKTLHNQMMYEWSAEQQNLVLITGHTHQPVFNSLSHVERLYLRLEQAQAANDTATIQKIEAELPRRKKEYQHVNFHYKNMRPNYFNTGCCCFSDGTITGIEIADGFIRLVKWSAKPGEAPQRVVAEETALEDLATAVLSR